MKNAFEEAGDRGREAALVDRAREGSHAAFAALVARHRRPLLRIARRRCGSAADAEEIVQEAFLRAYRGLGAFRGSAGFATWLFQIAINVARTRRRAARRRPTESLDALAFECEGSDGRAIPAAPIEELLDRKRAAERMQRAFGRLSETHRRVLLLRDLHERSSDEVARELGISPDTVRQRLHRARSVLRGELVEAA